MATEELPDPDPSLLQTFDDHTDSVNNIPLYLRLYITNLSYQPLSWGQYESLKRQIYYRLKDILISDGVAKDKQLIYDLLRDHLVKFPLTLRQIHDSDSDCFYCVDNKYEYAIPIEVYSRSVAATMAMQDFWKQIRLVSTRYVGVVQVNQTSSDHQQHQDLTTVSDSNNEILCKLEGSSILNEKDNFELNVELNDGQKVDLCIFDAQSGDVIKPDINNSEYLNHLRNVKRLFNTETYPSSDQNYRNYLTHAIAELDPNDSSKPKFRMNKHGSKTISTVDGNRYQVLQYDKRTESNKSRANN